MKSKVLLKVLSIVLVLGMLISYVPNYATAETGIAQQTVTVENTVLDEINKNGVATYWVEFESKSDLSQAYFMDWSERGWFVYETLKTQAEKTQAAAISYLDSTGVKYEVFWIANRILVTQSDRTVLASLQQLPNVTAITSQKEYILYEPEVVESSNEITTVESNISQVQAPEAWNLGYDGTGLVVASIDTGVRATHNALKSAYRGNNGDGTYSNDYNWFDPYGSYVNTPTDTNGHGTHTMGTMVGDDGGANQIGMAPGSEWIACRGCSNSNCTDVALLTCAQFIAAPTKTDGSEADPDMRPNVVNNSWGDCDQSYDAWYQDVVDAWLASGVYPVFANGNSSNCGYSDPPGLNTVGNPARYGNVTGVGSSGTSNGQYAAHSTWGPTDNPDTVNPADGYESLKPQVIAPGVNIRSSVPTSDSTYQSGWTGTSMSAPHVTGLVALVMQAAPCLIGDYAAVESLIESTATDIVYNDGSPLTPTNFPNFATGWGEINALAAVQTAAALCGNSMLTGTVTSDSAEPISGAKVVITGTETVNNRTVYTDNTGQYSAHLISDTYDIAVTAWGYANASAENVVVVDGAAVIKDFVLEEIPTVLVTGVVYDDGIEGGASHGYPLYSELTFSAIGYSETVYTDPVTGEYEIVLLNNLEYSVQVKAMLSDYQTLETTITADTQDFYEQDYYLNIDEVACAAPGYGPDYVVQFGFESGDDGFVASGTNSTWARGIPTNGPGAAHSGSYVIATNLTGNYNSNELSYMTSPTIDLTGFGSGTPIIEFWQWRSIENVNWDNVTVEATKTGGATWVEVYGPVGGMNDTAYNKVLITLDSSYNVIDFQFRFKLKSDSSTEYEGWYVDDIGIASYPVPESTLVYSENFDTDDGNFVASGANSSWAWGTPSGTLGPGSAYSSPNVWATNLTGHYNNNEEAYITSPVIDLSSYTGLSPILSLMHWFHGETSGVDYPSVEVSKDGGFTWVVIGQKFGDAITHWEELSFIMDPSFAVNNFQFRFHFHSDGSVSGFAGWYIDDVKVSVTEPYTISVPCGPTDGGLVVSYVYDANFPTEKLIGATVASTTTSGLTSANNSDPDHAGLYYSFQVTETDPDDVDFTISLSKYETLTESRSIEQHIVNEVNFELGAGLLTADPAEIEHTIGLHDDPEFTTLTLINEGTGGANFVIRESDQGFQPYSIPAVTDSVVENEAPSSIFRDPDAAETLGSLELNALSGNYGITAAPPAYGSDLYSERFYRWDDASVPGTSTLVGSPSATMLYAGDFLGDDFSTLYAISSFNNGLYSIDTATATSTLIGTTTPPSGAHFSGLAGTPDIMYAIATACNTASTLMEIDLTTGATTTIGKLTNANCIIDIAYVPADGMLYGVDLVTDSLHRIDPETGADTVVGSLGVNPNYAQGMDYDEENNVLYWAAYTTSAQLRIIDITTGASALVGNFTQGEVDSFSIAAGGLGPDVTWVNETPSQGYISALDEFAVEIEFNVDDIDQPGDYFAELKVSTDTPYAVPNIPVTLHVVRPVDYGNIKGNITATTKCDVDVAPFADATINFYKDGVLVYSVETDRTGYYTYALQNGTYDVEVVADGYVSQMQFGVVLGMNTDIVVDFELRLESSCLTVDPESFYQELNLNGTATQTMTLINTGALEAAFEISERPGDGPVPYSKAWDIELVLDDGTPEDAIGIGGTKEFLVINRFSLAENQYPFYLQQVDISFEGTGSVSVGDQLRIVIYQNTTGSTDPAIGSELLYQQDVVVESAAGWNNYILDEPIYLEGPGDVLIGAIFMEKPGTEYYPASIDLSTTQQNSWVGWWTGEIPAEPTLPSDSKWSMIDSLGFAGNWTIRGMGSAGLTEIVWLTEDLTAGVIPADGGTADVTLTFDANDIAWGDYFGTLRINNFTEGFINVPVQLRLLASQNDGYAQGTVSKLEACNVNPTPAAKTVVKFLQNDEVLYSVLTNTEGYYATAIPEGSYDVVVELNGYESQAVTGFVVTAGEQTVRDFNLRLLTPCLQASPVALEKYLLPDTIGTQVLRLTNVGAVDGTYELVELPVAGKSTEQLILDPSFEAYSPNPYWDEYSKRFGTPLCNEDDCGLNDGTGPHTGIIWTWFGGYGSGDNSYVSQEVEIAQGNASLTFWVEHAFCGTGGASNYLALLIDDVELWRTDSLDQACDVTGYSQIEIDVTDFADGASHTIKFSAVTVDFTSFFLDDVELQNIAVEDVLWLAEETTAGVIPAGESVDITITYDATGLVVGDYYATLRVKNAPSAHLDLPVVMHVVDEIPVFYIYLPLTTK